MPLPKEVTFVTFDVYGTLIDWETGIYEAFQREAEKDGFTIDREGRTSAPSVLRMCSSARRLSFTSMDATQSAGTTR